MLTSSRRPRASARVTRQRDAERGIEAVEPVLDHHPIRQEREVPDLREDDAGTRHVEREFHAGVGGDAGGEIGMHGSRTDRVQRVPRTRDRVLQDAVACLPCIAEGGNGDVAESREYEIEATRVLIGRDRDRVLDMLSRDDRLVRPRSCRKRKRAKNGERDEDSAHRGLLSWGSLLEYPPNERDGQGAEEEVASHGPPVVPPRRRSSLAPP